MKLRNKKTGEIFDALIREQGGNCAYSHIVCDIKAYEPNAGIKAKKHYVLGEYNSLTEINEEWEDYKPKEFYYIVQDGDIFSDNDEATKDYVDRIRAIDNYFETKEEAKKALEKLKAWKRLRDKGFRFEGWNWKSQCIDCSLDYSSLTEEQSDEADKDLALLFAEGE